MKGLVLHPTELSQWQAIVNEAQVNTHLILNENMESYLVFLLLRFSQGPKLINSIIALDFLNSVKTDANQQIERLREVGDKSLLFSGLFPELAKKRNLSLNYFSDMGQFAYFAASGFQDNEWGDLFNQLGQQFLILQKVLHGLRMQKNDPLFTMMR